MHCCSFELDRYHYNRPRLKNIEKGCQFGVPEDELVSVSGEKWCVFHLPKILKKEWSPSRIRHFNNAIHNHILSAKKNNKLADLSGVVFPGTISFQFKEEEKTYLPGILFIRSVFLGDISTENCVFEDIVHFNEATCDGQALLYGTIYREEVHFDYSCLGPNIHLGGSVFENHAYFQRAIFPSNAWLSNIIFKGRCWLQNAQFGSIVHFNDCVFTGEAEFSVCGKHRNEDPFIFSIIRFRGSRFCNRVSFANRTFSNTLDLENVIFKVAPEFHGCMFHQDTSFKGAIFNDRGKTNRGVVLDVYPREVDAARAYRTLKLAMENIRNKEEQARFFALEQESIRADSNTPKSIKLLSWLYGITSSYGQSIIKPLMLLAVMFMLFFATYVAITMDIQGGMALEKNLLFAFQQIFRPFSCIVQKGNPIFLVIFGIMHSVVNITLIAFIAIALRRRFRIG